MTASPRYPTFEDVDNHLGNKLMLLLFSYRATKDILSMNGFEVLRFIEEIESGRFNDVAFNQSRRSEYTDYQNHLIRYFHNFLAGAKTMIDHTRIMMRSEYISDAHRSAYQDRVSEISKNSLAKFVGDIRNYALHCGLPNLIHHYTFSDEKWDVALHLRDLQSWDGWTARSRDFLKEHPEQIRLSWLVGSYIKIATSLHEWLVQSFLTYYKEVFDDFDSLRSAYHIQNNGEQGSEHQSTTRPESKSE